MTQVDFYILKSESLEGAWQQACQLLSHDYQEQQPVFVELTDQQQAQRFDDLLWTFEDSSFVPHALTDANITAPIQIGYHPPHSEIKTWINLSYRDLAPTEQYQRIIEIVPEQKFLKEAARIRFRQYRQQGFELVTHNLG